VSLSAAAGRRRPVTIVLTTAAITALALVGTGSVQARPGGTAAEAATYIVQVAGAPIASYTGGVAGIAATRPAQGDRVDTRSTAARALRSRLDAQHGDVLRRAGVAAGQKVYDYSVSFNGFAARLTAGQAARLKSAPGVLRVWQSEVLKADTISTPRFLGLEGSGGVWDAKFGSPDKAGLGVIVGVVDTGIWPENPSFAALPEPRPDQRVIDAKWHGTCTTGVEEPIACNNKLIGARYYNAGGLAPEWEFQSPRDYGGHGSHTSSTAAGNHGVAVTINGQPVGTASGVAPAARVAMYKALWEQPGGGGSGATEDLLAAVEAAVADGVDVINYSISGSRLYVVDPIEIAFLNAAAAGVFVSASAGNSGATVGVSSVAHNSPWITTVAASTHDRGSRKTVTLGNGASYTGAGVGAGVGPAPLVDAATAALAGADPVQAALCFIGTLDPAKVTGKIVLCQRGTNARVDKSRAVQQAGGAGMIMFNPSPNTTDADFHFVPSIHVDHVAGPAIKAYAATASPTATISAATPVTLRAPAMAAFSSYGPALAGSGDLLKPDVTGPGVDVVAAVAPPGNAGNSWSSYAGTSMSAPHVAGLAALLMSKYRKWSPMWVKSAIMTTAGTTDNTGAAIQRGAAAATPLDYGNGHIKPFAAFNPGLVYSSTPTDWLRYACGINQLQLVTDPSFCQQVGSIDPSNLNYASIAVGDLAGSQTVTRTVTNVTEQASTYDASVAAPAGFTVSVSPSRLAVAPGRTATFTVTITRVDAAVGQWKFGSLTWRDRRGHSVRSAIAVRPVALAAPVEITATGTSGSTALAVKAGYAGTLTAAPAGLDPSTVTGFHLVGTNTGFDSANPQTGPAVGRTTVTVPAGTKLARFAMFDGDHPAGTDLDLYVYQAGTATLVGSSGGGTAEESVTLTAAGTYDVYVVQFALPSGVGELDVRHHHWAVDDATGNLTVSPASQTVGTGQATSVTASWSGLAAGSRYLGLIEYGDGTSVVSRTVLGVNG